MNLIVEETFCHKKILYERKKPLLNTSGKNKKTEKIGNCHF